MVPYPLKTERRDRFWGFRPVPGHMESVLGGVEILLKEDIHAHMCLFRVPDNFKSVQVFFSKLDS